MVRRKPWTPEGLLWTSWGNQAEIGSKDVHNPCTTSHRRERNGCFSKKKAAPKSGLFKPKKLDAIKRFRRKR